MSTLRVQTLLPALSLLALVASRSDAAATYSYTDLGTVETRAINNQGQVVGNQLVGPPGPSVLYNSLGPNAGQTTTISNVYNAVGINANSQVVGTSSPGGSLIAGPSTGVALRAQDVPTSVEPAATQTSPIGGPTPPIPAALNDAAQVVGSAVFGSSPNHAFITTNGITTDLGTLAGGSGSSFATGINNQSQVVGGSAIDGTITTPFHAFLYSGGVMSDLGTLGGKYSTAYGINAASQVIGASTTGDGQLHAFLSGGGKLNDLGTLGGTFSIANAINVSGAVVGNSDTAAGANHAFLYSDGVMKDLNSLVPPGSPWSLTSAVGINDLGQIIGLATDATGEIRGYLLTPSSILPPPIPEPATVAVFGLAAAGLALRAASKGRRAPL